MTVDSSISTAAAELNGAELSLFWALPFAGLLVSIALFPLLAPRFWEHHQSKIVAAAVALVVGPLLLSTGPAATLRTLVHSIALEYVPFILLLLALFTVAGGIVVKGNLHGTPLVNAGLLAIGAGLASIIGTTGASMVMIRPLLRANDDRKHNAHTVVFFIFLVCNIGGALTPLGDPPLFLGFLRGVDFFWTTIHMILPMMLALSIVLGAFLALDLLLYRREGHLRTDPTPDSPIRVGGIRNIALIGVIIAAILASALLDLGALEIAGSRIELAGVLRDATMIVVTLVSLAITPRSNHEANGFNWSPIKEVAILFAGIFATLIPVLAILRAGVGGAFAPLLSLVESTGGAPDNLTIFWMTGVLSSFLDNAPTYLVFFELAGGDAKYLMTTGVTTLVAISAGAVFMGANTYIGNAPNFMVYAIARNAGVRMPGFFGYIKWSAVVLIPTFAILSLVFFI